MQYVCENRVSTVQTNEMIDNEVAQNFATLLKPFSPVMPWNSHAPLDWSAIQNAHMGSVVLCYCRSRDTQFAGGVICMTTQILGLK